MSGLRREVSVATLGWLGLGSVFVLMRLAYVLEAPVGGAELIHLSGAWQARIGVDDARFAPTLFQAVSALLLHASSSELPSRLLAFAATGTIPGALYLLRPRLGEAGALLALVLLAFDAPAITLGGSATAMGFDLAVTTWLFVALSNRWELSWGWVPAGFLVATAGPLPLALAAGALGLTLVRGGTPRLRPSLLVAAGMVAGVVLTSLRFGLGPDGLRVAPFDLFGQSFDERWSTANGFELAGLYTWPLLAGGLGATAAAIFSFRRDVRDDTTLLLLAWAGVGAAWWLAAGASHSPLAGVALTTPLAILLGPQLVRALSAMTGADWRLARILIPLAAVFVLLALANMVDWARNGEVGGGDEQFRVAAFCAVALGGLAIAASSRRSLPAVLAPLGAAAVLALLPGAFGVALAGGAEPLPSPLSTPQVRDLRDIAFQASRDNDGPIVIHSSLRDDATWPFRDSGDVVFASRVPPLAAVLVWPATAARPDGFSVVEGDWALVREMEPPTSGFLDVLRWYVDRNTLAVSPAAVAVYTRAKE